MISCGENNRYGHPSPQVLERLDAAGAHVYRTDRAGAVILEVKGKKSADKKLWEQCNDRNLILC